MGHRAGLKQDTQVFGSISRDADLLGRGGLKKEAKQHQQVEGCFLSGLGLFSFRFRV